MKREDGAGRGGGGGKVRKKINTHSSVKSTVHVDTANDKPSVRRKLNFIKGVKFLLADRTLDSWTWAAKTVRCLISDSKNEKWRRRKICQSKPFYISEAASMTPSTLSMLYMTIFFFFFCSEDSELLINQNNFLHWNFRILHFFFFLLKFPNFFFFWESRVGTPKKKLRGEGGSSKIKVANLYEVHHHLLNRFRSPWIKRIT